jgi:peptide deformylase
MAKLAIREFPDPVLKQATQPIKRIDAAVSRLISALQKTMYAFPHCVGLAAPQVGYNLRVAVMDPAVHPKVQHSVGLLVLVNPQVIAAQDWKVCREGCLSVPDFTANVMRALRVCIRAQDEQGQPYERWLEGFDAHVAQHEIDHLDGKLFLDRVANLKTDVFRRKTYL